MNLKLDSGKTVIIKQSMKYDRVHQINRVKWHHFIDGKEYIEPLDMRCFFPQEMDALLDYNGFEIMEKYGDFQRGAFVESSTKQIFICRKK